MSTSADLITTAQAGERLGISARRVRVLVKSGRLPAQRLGRDHLIRVRDLAAVAVRVSGWPKGKPRKETG